MGDLSNIDSVFIALAFIAPGYILCRMRNQFVTGREDQGTEQLIRFFTYSILNYAVFSWLIYIVVSSEIQNAFAKGFFWFLILFICPAALGLFLGISIQRDWSHKFFRFVGLQPVHVVPTAWDWKFGRMQDQWVLVTLIDDTKYAGLCGVNSFISSDPQERDLYIERIYDLSAEGVWEDRGDNGVLICKDQIKAVEFWPYYERETSDAF